MATHPNFIKSDPLFAVNIMDCLAVILSTDFLISKVNEYNSYQSMFLFFYDASDKECLLSLCRDRVSRQWVQFDRRRSLGTI